MMQKLPLLTQVITRFNDNSPKSITAQEIVKDLSSLKRATLQKNGTHAMKVLLRIQQLFTCPALKKTFHNPYQIVQNLTIGSREFKIGQVFERSFLASFEILAIGQEDSDIKQALGITPNIPDKLEEEIYSFFFATPKLNQLKSVFTPHPLMSLTAIHILKDFRDIQRALLLNRITCALGLVEDLETRFSCPIKLEPFQTPLCLFHADSTSPIGKKAGHVIEEDSYIKLLHFNPRPHSLPVCPNTRDPITEVEVDRDISAAIELFSYEPDFFDLMKREITHLTHPELILTHCVGTKEFLEVKELIRSLPSVQLNENKKNLLLTTLETAFKRHPTKDLKKGFISSFIAHVSNCLVCPITKQLFDKPVSLPCGHVYSEHAIGSWLENNSFCPLDNIPTTYADLSPHDSFQQIVSFSTSIEKSLLQNSIKSEVLSNLHKHNGKFCSISYLEEMAPHWKKSYPQMNEHLTPLNILQIALSAIASLQIAKELSHDLLKPIPSLNLLETQKHRLVRTVISNTQGLYIYLPENPDNDFSLMHLLVLFQKNYSDASISTALNFPNYHFLIPHFQIKELFASIKFKATYQEFKLQSRINHAPYFSALS